MNHNYTTETLYHYKCCICKRWWSVGDHQNPNEAQGCPHCGAWAEVKPKSKIMEMAEKFKLWICVLCVCIFACACLTGSARLHYESSNRTIEYERETPSVQQQ